MWSTEIFMWGCDSLHIYQFEQSDGYYSKILTHEKKFTETEIQAMLDEIPFFRPNRLEYKCKWLIENKDFKAVNYTQIDIFEGYVEERK